MPPQQEPSEHEKEKIERLRRAMYSRSLSGMLGERPRHTLGKSQQVVGENWEEKETGAEPSMVAPPAMGLVRKILWWFLGASVIFFIAALAFFGYYFTLGSGSFSASPSNIDISISGPPQIAGGEPAKLQLVVTNRNKVPLQLADLVITYPAGTRSPTDFSTDFPTQRISLGTIEPGGSRQGTVSAVFAGTEGEHANVKVELEYRVSGSSAVFVAQSGYDVTFSSSPITLSIAGNTETISGQPVQVAVTLSSNAGAPIKDALLRVDFPFGFTFTGADPAPAQSGLWVGGDILPGQNKTVTIRGSLSVGINNETGGGIIAAPGDTVTVSVAYQNNLSTEITDAIIVARLSGIVIDGTTVKTADGFFRSTDDTVLWDKNTTNGVLADLAPGARGSVSFSFQMPSSDALKNIKSPHLDISVNAAGQRLSESGVPQNLQSASRQTIKLATDLQLNAQALYYASPFGSSGPMPPKAGTETTYGLVFTVTNSTNKISGARLTATLPSYVRWIGSHAPAAENLSFNQTDGTFTWNIGDIVPGTGIGSTTPRQLAIAIGFTPSTSQIGDQPVLVQNVTLRGLDAATGASISRTTAPNVTTNLATVSKSSGETIVGTDPGFAPANATVVK